MKSRAIKIIFIFSIIILILAIAGFIFDKITNEKLKADNKKIIEENKIQIEKYKIEIEKFKKEDAENKLQLEKLKKENKILTKKQLEKIPCEEKDNIILTLQDDKTKLFNLCDIFSLEASSLLSKWADATFLLEKTTNQLNITNERLKKLNKKFGFGIYGMAGFTGLKRYLEDQTPMELEIIIGEDILFNFFNNRISLEVGLYEKIYKEIGFGGKLGLKFFIN
jgi:hypothetical protein